MFHYVTFFRQAIVAANLVCATSGSPTNPSPLPPAAVRAAVQQEARPAARPALQPISDLHPAAAGDRSNCDCRGLPSYTVGWTEDQEKAMH
jgi:hypothetical protein